MEFIAGTIDVNGSISEKQVWTSLQKLLRNEAGYCGYKKPSISVKSEEIPSFIIISKKSGIVLIDVIDHEVLAVEEEYWTYGRQETFYSRDIILTTFVSEVANRLKKDTALYNRKEDKVLLPISSRLVFLQNTQVEVDNFTNGESITVKTLSKDNFEQQLKEFFASLYQEGTSSLVSDANYDRAMSVLEGTDTLRKKQPAIKVPISKNDFIQKSLEETFKLDETQRQVAMQLPNGPQRIRGLAGTGKTVILCLKAAIAHQEFPDYKILFLFHTRSMYPQVRELIAKYYTREAKQPVNWENIQVLHAWGGETTVPGFYWSLCQKYGVEPVTFHGEVSLRNIFKLLLTQCQDQLQPVYDLVLIDEAQDLPPELFETVFYLTKGEAERKRIVWATDEFQTLTDLGLPTEPEQLFGVASDGKPNLPNTVLASKEGLIKGDYTLSNSYRNPRLGLMVAHALALRLYSSAGEVERMGDKNFWKDCGYRVIEKFDAGDQMVIERPEEFSKNKLETLLTENHPDNRQLIQVGVCLTRTEEIKFVVDKIRQLIANEGIDPTEIIVVTLDLNSVKTDLFLIRQALDRLKIRSTTPGFIEDASVFKEKGTVTLTTPFRTKGHEGHVVFVINAQKAVEDTLLRARNALFVAITRARGWCYITGHGESMRCLENEINSLLADYPYFKLPSNSPDLPRQDSQDKWLDQLIQSHRDLLIERLARNQAMVKAITERADTLCR